jgi:hypothetical protein
MKLALVLGGASGVATDYLDFLEHWGRPNGLVACNDAIAEFCNLTAGVTLHPENLGKWLAKRKANGFPSVPLYTHKVTKRFPKLEGMTLTDYNFPGQPESMTSAVMAAKVALIDLGFDRVVFCGVPMTNTPHFIHRPEAPTWDIADHYFKRWKMMIAPEYRARMRSMSGRTRDLLGAPDEEFCRG